MSGTTGPVLRFDADRGVLAALLGLAGGSASPTPLSARGALEPPGSLSGSELGRLAELKVLTRAQASRRALSPAFRRAAAVLLEPATLVTVRLRSPFAELHAVLRFPGSVAAGGGVSLTPVDGRCRIASPISGEDVFALVDSGFLASVPAVEAQSFRAILDPTVAATFFGIVDWVRLGGGAPAREAAGLAAIRVGPIDLRRLLGWPRVFTRPDCFTPYLALSLGSGCGSGPAAIETAFQRLTAAGLLRSEAGRYGLAGALLDLAGPAVSIGAAVQWHELRARGTEGALASRVALALGEPPRMLLVIDAADGGILLTTPGSNELRKDFEEATGDASRPTATRKLRYCPQCRAELRPGLHFCPRCRTSLKPGGS